MENKPESDIEALEEELKELKAETKTAKQKTDLEKEIKALKAEKKERNKKPSKTKGIVKFMQKWADNLYKD